MSKKAIIELSVYSNADWDYDRALFSDYVSKYFDNDLYEYTTMDHHTVKVRRVFDLDDKGLDKISCVFGLFRDSIHSRSNTKFFANHIKDLLKICKYKIDSICESNKQDEFSDHYNRVEELGDVTIKIDVLVKIIESDAKRVKHIVFED